MIRKAILSLGMLAAASTAFAQSQLPCATDQIHEMRKANNPNIAVQEAKLKADLDRLMKGHMQNAFAKVTASDTLTNWVDDTTIFHIPVVVHIITDQQTGQSRQPFLADNDIYAMIDRVNTYYSGANPGIPAGIIKPFQKYIGNAHIQFHLATKDPAGKPTRGIVRTYSNHATGGDELAKISPWAPDQYVNIYLENKIGKGVANGEVEAYATFPTDYEDNPYSQGVISRANQALSGSTLAHELGHFFYLYHPWNSNNVGPDVGVCGDDEVDDTPPTEGHFLRGCRLYDTMCATGYFRNYDAANYYTMTGLRIPGEIAANLKSGLVVNYNDSLGEVLGQTFKTDGAESYLDGITVVVVPGASTGALAMSLYDASGTTLIAKSGTNPGVSSGLLKFNFNGTLLWPNTTYKFEIDTVGRHRKFALRATDTPYLDGAMYRGVGANTIEPSKDLTFSVDRFYRIDYPDTVNTQNIMDYSACQTEMFTKGQVARMRAALRSNVGYRSKLRSSGNLLITGVWDSLNNVAIPAPDIAPVADFSLNRYFLCADGSSSVEFANRSYNDTATVEWTFSNDPVLSASTSNVVTNAFSKAGWVTVSLKATSNAGDNTLTRSDVFYAADPTPTQASGYFQEFTNQGENERYPIFNYFNTDHKWEIVNNAGFYDQTCIRYANYDKRTPDIGNGPGSPMDDYSDFYTPAFDLSGYTSICRLSFFSAGAFRTNKPGEMNDKLEVAYSNNCGISWFIMDSLTKGVLGNNGYLNDPYSPTAMNQWKEQGMNIPTRDNQVYFRFRFYPGVANPGNAIYNPTVPPPFTNPTLGTGNNFYLDRINITAFPVGVKNGVIADLGMSIIPNPTNGAATIRLNGGDNSQAVVSVTDVTGKVVYSTSVRRASTSTQVEIPAAAISVKGLYLVKVVTEGATETQKLVAY